MDPQSNKQGTLTSSNLALTMGCFPTLSLKISGDNEPPVCPTTRLAVVGASRLKAQILGSVMFPG